MNVFYNLTNEIIESLLDGIENTDYFEKVKDFAERCRQDTWHRVTYADLLVAAMDSDDKSITFFTDPQLEPESPRCMISFKLDREGCLSVERIYFIERAGVIDILEHHVDQIDNLADGWYLGSPRIPYVICDKLYSDKRHTRTRSLPGAWDWGYFSLNLTLSGVESLRIRLHTVIGLLRFLRQYNWDKRVIHLLAKAYYLGLTRGNLTIETNHFSKQIWDIFDIELTTSFGNAVHKLAYEEVSSTRMSINVLFGYAHLIVSGYANDATDFEIKWARQFYSCRANAGAADSICSDTAYIWNECLKGLDDTLARELFFIGSLACFA